MNKVLNYHVLKNASIIQICNCGLIDIFNVFCGLPNNCILKENCIVI